MTVEPPPHVQQNNWRRNRAMTIAICCFAVLGGFYFVYWWLYGRFYEWTDDAYVSGNKVIVTPQVPGIITSVTTDNTFFVPKGRVLIELDKADASIALDRSIDDLRQAVKETMKLMEQAKQAEAVVPARKAEFIQAVQDFEHRKSLVKEGGVSLEDFQHAQARLEESFFLFIAAEHAAIASLALVENTSVETHPIVEQAKEQLRKAYLFYQRCTIEAPVTGIVAQRAAQVGERVEPGQPLLAIIPLNQMWIDANYKETQLKKVRIGQPATITTDLYGDEVLYEGTVVGIAGGTGSVFSVLPPQNATGNWIKIVQRLPVRIELNPEQLRQFPLRLGLSVETTIDLHDTKLPLLPQVLPETPLYATDVFEKQEDGSNELIQKVIRENLSPTFIEDLSTEEER